MRLSTCIHQFFDQYLPRIKGVGDRTIEAYREAFSLFLHFAAEYHSIKIASLRTDHLSSNMILAFLDYLEIKRGNTAKTRNHRLAALKSFAKMIRFKYPEERKLGERILNIPQKRTKNQLIGFLYFEEALKVFQAVDLRKKQGFRDYTLLHLLYDSGARASEIARLNLDYFTPQEKTLAILGKGGHYRLIELWPKTARLVKLYITRYRAIPRPMYRQRLFINQRREEFSRHGISRICKKYLSIALPNERVKMLNPVHSFRHSCAVNMVSSGYSISELKYHLGHRNIDSTIDYFHLNLSRRREIQKKMNEYTQSILPQDPKIEELIDWENKRETLSWLDSL